MFAGVATLRAWPRSADAIDSALLDKLLHDLWIRASDDEEVDFRDGTQCQQNVPETLTAARIRRKRSLSCEVQRSHADGQPRAWAVAVGRVARLGRSNSVCGILVESWPASMTPSLT